MFIPQKFAEYNIELALVFLHLRNLWTQYETITENFASMTDINIQWNERICSSIRTNPKISSGHTKEKYSQTWANDHLQVATTCL